MSYSTNTLRCSTCQGQGGRRSGWAWERCETCRGVGYVLEPAELDHRIGTAYCGDCRGQGEHRSQDSSERVVCETCRGIGLVLDPAFEPERVIDAADRELARRRVAFMRAVARGERG